MKTEIPGGADMQSRRSIRRTFFLFVGSTISITGCAKQKTASVPAQPKPKAETINAKSAGDWAPKQVEDVAQYLIEDSATISINSDSSHTTSIQTRIVYALTYSVQSDSLLLRAKVESLTTSPQEGRISGARTGSTAPQLFSVMTSPYGNFGQIREQNPSQCVGGVDPIAARILELTISYPKKRVRIGDKWTDTVSTTTCRGKTALLQASIRSYELLELTKSDSGSLAKIGRQVATVFEAATTDTKNRLSATGSGSSSSIIYALTTTGAIKSSSGQSQSILTISTSRGSYPFTQTVFTQIERR